MKISIKHFRWIGILVFLLILWNTDFRKLWDIIQSTSLHGIGLYAASIFAFIIIRICRIWALVRALGHQVSLWRLSLVTLESGFWGLITPGRIGEFSRIYFLRQHGVPISEATLLSIVERLTDLFFLLLVGFGALIFIGQTFDRATLSGLGLLGVLAILGILGLSLIVILKRSDTFQICLGYIWKKLPERWRGAITEKQLFESLGKFTEKTAISFAWTGILILTWKIVTIVILARAVGLEIGLAPLIAAYSVSALLSTLPITINGLGLRESGYITVLAFFGVSVEQAVLFSVVEAFAIPLLVGTMAFSIFKALDIIWETKRAKKSTETQA